MGWPLQWPIIGSGPSDDRGLAENLTILTSTQPSEKPAWVCDREEGGGGGGGDDNGGDGGDDDGGGGDDNGDGRGDDNDDDDGDRGSCPKAFRVNTGSELSSFVRGDTKVSVVMNECEAMVSIER